MTQVLKNKKGVTLVELLAVIVIMGIIAAIAVPAIGGLIKNSERKAAETEYANLLDAARLYAQSEDPKNPFTISEMVTKEYWANDDITVVAGTPASVTFNIDGSIQDTITSVLIDKVTIIVSTGKAS
jgi:type IV pilus assembly protein PilA